MTRLRRARLLPIVGLTLALTVPAAGLGAPSPDSQGHGRGHGKQKQDRHEKHDKHQKHEKRAKKAHVRGQNRAERRDRVRREVRRDERRARQLAQVARQERWQIDRQRAAVRRLEIQRAARQDVLNRQALRQEALRRQQVERRLALRPQALRRDRFDATWQRQEAARRAAVRRNAGRGAWYDRGIANRPGAGIVHLRGEVTAEGLRCTAMRGDDGRLYTLEGDVVPGVRPGDDIQVAARVLRSSPCRQGTTLGVERLSYLDRRDGARWDDRLDDRWDGGRRDRGSVVDRIFGGDRRAHREARDRGSLLVLHGRLAGAGGCPVLRADDGRSYELSGNLGGYGRGDDVRVVGVAEGGTRCGVGPALRVAEITRP